MIICERLTKFFGKIRAIQELSLKIPDGQIFGLLGPNGAGKTTTMRMLATLIRPTYGRATVDKFEVGPESNNLKIRAMIGLLPETPGLYATLGAYKNLDYYAQLYDVPKAKREENIERILKDLDLWDRREEPVGGFSKGMKQKLAIARALVHEPKYIFLDEPTASLDPKAAKTVRDFILDLKSKGNTILINTHNLAEAERICNNIALIKNHLVRVGKPKELARGLFARSIRVTMDRIPKALTNKISALSQVEHARVEGEQLVLDVKNPEEDNNKIISWLMAKGFNVQFVSEEEYSLEDVYLKLIEEGGK
ncbi:ABC transporter ATP-binding protein [[Eubacterium] cellulosolvens]